MTSEWEQLGLADLAHLNDYTKRKLLDGNTTIPFYALDVHWAEAIGPSIPDGR